MPKNTIQVGPRVSGGGTSSVPRIPDVTAFVADDPVPVEVDGSVKAKIILHYTSPAVLGTGDLKFTGVVPHVQTPSKTVDFDAFNFDGGAAENVTKEILLDYPAADETWTVYLCSKSDTTAKPLVLKGRTGATPNCDVMVSGGPFDMDAPDVLAFTAGTLNQTTGAWTPAMRWEPLKSKMLVDWGCLLPSDTLNWSGFMISIELPDGTFVDATDLITADQFTQTDAGLVCFGCIAIEGEDIPTTPTEWRFIACSYDRDGAPNHDGDGDPIGPVVRLSTLAPQTKPITDIGQVNLDTATGSMSFSNIHDIGSINITTFTGNLPISRIDNLGSINITTFAGNWDASRITNLGAINIGTLSGNLDVTKVANLGSFGIQNFEGVLVTQQLADGIMSDLNKYAASFRPITKVAALPVPPGDDYPDKTVVLRTSDSTLWKNNAGTWQAVSASDTITGKISDGDILSVNCSKFVGQINAANVTTIRVDSLVGSLSVAQCNALTISNFTGNLDVSRVQNITTLSISSLQGNLDASRVSNIGTISISSLSGNLDASRVANLGSISITTFTGNLDASHVNNLGAINIGSLSGSLDISRVSNIGTLAITTFSGTITNLNVNTLSLTGQWGDGHIAALNVAKLNTGTMTVGSGGLTFSGSGGILLSGGGGISALVGGIYVTSATIKNAGAGWDILGGPFAYISGASVSYINTGTYKCNGVSGQTAVHTFPDQAGTVHTLTFNGGLLTDWTTSV